jgi:hypothetical protein
MAKSKSKEAKRQQKAKQLAIAGTSRTVVAAPVLPVLVTACADGEELVAADEIEITVDVLNTLLQQPEMLSNQRFKQLKRVGWDFGKVLAEQGSGSGECMVS